MNRLKIVFCWVSLVGLAGCGTVAGLGGKDYQRDQVRGEQSVRVGVIDSVREVNIEGTRSGVGAATGGIVGGVAGSTIGQGRGSIVGAVVGALAGGVAGAATEQGVTKQKGVELTIRLDDGQYIAVTQAADETFLVGDAVKVLGSGSGSRVTRRN
jgi:outer membrane lipoprotein SlyB